MSFFSSKQLLFFVISIVLLCPSPLADITSAIQQGYYYNCSTTGNYTSNSIYKSNLNSLFSALSSNTNITYGFYNFSYGQDPDKVYLIALCRGDLSPQQCNRCFNNKSQLILQDCPNQREAIGWYEKCMIRYSNKSILGDLEYDPKGHLLSPHDIANISGFNQVLMPLLYDLKNQTASSVRKYAAGTASDGNTAIYALSQCTPDLSQTDCKSCLNALSDQIPDCCEGVDGARVLQPSCNLRYETSLFYDPAIAPPQPPSSPLGKKSSNNRIIVIIVVVCLAATVVLIICFCTFRRARKPVKKLQYEDEIESGEKDSSRFDLATIKDATANFSEENKLGQGGFGAVYKGTLRNGTEIAVKRLSGGSLQGNVEFKNEVLLMAKLQHRNLARLLGFCLDREERLLIYEFVVNSSLDRFIFDPVKHEQLDWIKRYKIIVGIARGLLYLHEDSQLRIIHRDLKASNILLDAEMNPKISDFGMAKLFLTDQSKGNTSKIAGTYGYMAPEYAVYGEFSVKSDVFSFGVLLLEIVSGRKNVYSKRGENVEDLLSFTWKNWSKGTPMNVVDPTLSTGSDIEKIRCIHIGLLCVQENVDDRPAMASVFLMLNSFSLSFATPSQPAFFLASSTRLERSSTSDHDSRLSSTSKSNEEALPISRNEASITELFPR